MSVMQGYKVVDLSVGMAGPIVGMFFSDFGAEVVKIEKPEGDPARATAGFAAYNRGKASVVVDPAREERVAWLADLIAKADVLLVTSRTQLRDFGLDLFELCERLPALLVVEVPPFLASYAPWWGGHESSELLAAFLGQSARQASDSGDPVDSVYPTAVYVQGVWATTCAVAALIEREGSGFGQVVTVTGVNAMQQMTTLSLSTDPDKPDPNMAVGGGGRHPTYGRMKAKDGRWVISGGIGTKMEELMFTLLDRREFFEEFLEGRTVNMFKPENLPIVSKLVDEAFLAKDAHEWVEILEDVSIPTAILRSRDAWLDDVQVIATGLRAEVDDPERGHIVMPGVGPRLVDTPGSVKGPAPTLGQDDDRDFAWPSRQQPSGQSPLRPGPLSGYRVLNVGTFVATPYAGALLSELGADVVKVEPPAGDAFRQMAYPINRGMRSLAVDLQSPRGIEAFCKVVESVDVVMDGLRPGVTHKLGIDYESLRRCNPSIITMSLSGYGEGGPLSSKGGVDMILQGISGMMMAEGGQDDPVANTVAIIDTTTAVTNALTVTLALLHRVRTGKGQRAWNSLLATATYLQLGELVRFEDRTPPRVGARNHKGSAALDRIYQTSDRWVRVQEAPGGGGVTAVRTALGIEIGDVDNDEATRRIQAALIELDSRSAVSRLNESGLPAVTVRRVTEVMRDPRLVGEEFVHIRASDVGDFIAEPTRLATFTRTPRFGIRVPPGVGEHTVSLLEDRLIDRGEIDQLLADGVVSANGPMKHMLGLSYR